MKILLAAEDSGSIKEVQFAPFTDTSVKIQDTKDEPKINTFAAQGRSKCVNQLIRKSNECIYCGRQNGVIECYNKDYELVNKWICNGFSGRFVGLASTEDHIIGADEKGSAYIIAVSKNSEKHDSDVEGEKIDPIKLINKGTISTFVYGHELFAFGGEKIDLQVVKINLKKQTVESVFKAKNVKNNKLNLEVPVWIKNIQILSSQQFITVTKYGEIRQYDFGKGRRPYSDTKISQYSLDHVVVGDLKSLAVISDSHSMIAQYNLETGRLQGNFSGPTGAVQTLEISNNVLTVGGLDRYLRIYDLKSRKQIGKIFTGTHITRAILIGNDYEAKKDNEDDELWEKLEQSSDKKSSKKRKRDNDKKDKDKSSNKKV